MAFALNDDIDVDVDDDGDASDEDKQEPKQGWRRRSCFNVVACTFYLQLCILTTRDKAIAADMNGQRKHKI